MGLFSDMEPTVIKEGILRQKWIRTVSAVGHTNTKTTLYNPQSNGLEDRFDRTLLDMLSFAVRMMSRTGTYSCLISC